MFLNLWCCVKNEKIFHVIPIQMTTNFIAYKLIVILNLLLEINRLELHGLITIDLSLIHNWIIT